MSRLAFIFPGQGVQKVGMGKEVYESYPPVKEMFEKAKELMGFDLTNLIFSGPVEELTQTKNTQPAVFMVSMAYLKVLDDFGIHADIVAGHSLGEYSACVAAGVFPWSEALVLVKKRAELMNNAYPKGKGKMAAVLGLTGEAVKDVCLGIKEIGVVEPVNFNAPGQVVISGEIKAVEKASEELKKRGAKRIIFIDTSGPFHSSLMDKAAAEFSDYLDKTNFTKAGIPVISNVSGKPLTDPEEIRKALSLQVKSPVLWEDSMRVVLNAGSKDFIEVGPGNVLKGLLRRIDKEAKVECMDDKWKEIINKQ